MRPGPAALLLFLLFLASALWQFVIVDPCFLPYLLNGAGGCQATSPLGSATMSETVLLALNAAVTFVVVRFSRSCSWLAVLGNAAIAIVLVRATWVIGRDASAGFEVDAIELKVFAAALVGAAAGLLMVAGFLARSPRE